MVNPRQTSAHPTQTDNQMSERRTEYWGWRLLALAAVALLVWMFVWGSNGTWPGGEPVNREAPGVEKSTSP